MTRRDLIVCSAIALIIPMGLGGPAALAATPLYWPGGQVGYDRPFDDMAEPPRRRIVRQPRMPKDEAARAEKLAQGAAKPTGPLVIAISLEQQTMKVYDANGFFTETPISSGMKGHSTPMGVFSVIQKNKWHRSNLYSDAPMPYMQRLTWSGVAIHAGALPGYPASHGCVRMPMTFAVKMWRWTRMGARVVITPNEIRPAALSHPLLASLKAAQTVPLAQSYPSPDAKPADAAPLANTPVANTKTADAGNSVAGAIASDAPKMAVPLSKTEKPAEPAAGDTVQRGGPITIFVSRQDARLYVRKNFATLFEVPVTISGDQPLGTHVLTAYADKDAAKSVQWTALTLPAAARQTDTASSRQRPNAATLVPPTVPPSAAEALDRLKLPDDLLARLGGQLTAGSSLLMSDQGIAASGETGAGTDFIIRLR